MARVYSLEFENQSITTAGGDRDLFYVAPGDDKDVKVLGWTLSQFSDVGDAAEEILRLRLIRGHTTVGSGGTAYTAANVARVEPGDSNPSFVARHNDTTIASAGTAVNLWSGGFNIRVGEIFWLPQECQWTVTQTEGSVVLRLMAGPADDVTMSGTFFVMEMG